MIFTADALAAAAKVLVGIGAGGERTCAFMNVGAGGRTGETV